VEEIYLPEDGRTELDANVSIADAEWAEQEARRADTQPGLVLWTDGSRDENGGWGALWCGGREGGGPERKSTWDSSRKHTTRSARAIVRALAVAAERAKRHKLGRVRIFTDAQAAITRMTHDEPGPGQTHALQARQAIAALRRQEPAVESEIRWCPAHKGTGAQRSPRK